MFYSVHVARVLQQFKHLKQGTPDDKVTTWVGYCRPDHKWDIRSKESYTSLWVASIVILYMLEMVMMMMS